MNCVVENLAFDVSHKHETPPWLATSQDNRNSNTIMPFALSSVNVISCYAMLCYGNNHTSKKQP